MDGSMTAINPVMKYGFLPYRLTVRKLPKGWRASAILFCEWQNLTYVGHTEIKERSEICIDWATVQLSETLIKADRTVYMECAE